MPNKTDKLVLLGKLKLFLRILAIALVLFVLINFRLPLAVITNTVRFVSGSASRYDREIQALCAKIQNETETVTFSKKSISSTTFQRLCHEVSGGIPENFFVSGLSFRETDTSFTLYIKYAYKGQARIKAMTEYEQLLDSFVSKVDNSLSKVEKVKFVHDYIAKHYSYSTSNSDAYTMLKNGNGCCTSYSLLFKAVMQRLGIPCEVIWSTTYNHAWNAVKLGGLWYQIDTTWDDKGDSPDYTYMLITDNAIAGNGHGQWQNCGKYKIACFSPLYQIKYSKLRKAK